MVNGRTVLSRDTFRESVFARDAHKCVVCGSPAVDAHHIMERRLFDNGGYMLDNGASVCTGHHLDCEMTLISPADLRALCGIQKAVLPDHFYDDEQYTKWGDILLANGTRLRGELFFDESVQKILDRGRVLDLYTNRVKAPRTHHVPWSEGMHEDDRQHENMDGFKGRRVVVTLKMDGENTTMYSNGIHARSIDGRHHISRDWVKGFWSTIAHDIPPDYRVTGENVYAKHSIPYDDLPTFFMGFGVWNERNVCLSWDDSIEWFGLLGITSVPVLYDGLYDEKVIRALYRPEDWATREGYVIRLADSFPYGAFRHSVGKFVRKNHVATTQHWMHGRAVEPNRLKQE